MSYLEGDEAIDVSRMTGIPWSWQRVETRRPRVPYIDLLELTWWERWRVLWCRIGAHRFVDAVEVARGASRMDCAMARRYGVFAGGA